MLVEAKTVLANRRVQMVDDDFKTAKAEGHGVMFGA